MLGFIIVILVAIPFTVYIAQKRQQTTTKAAASTTLSFDPTSATVKVGDTVLLNIILDPGTGVSANQVSFIKLSINYDASKFTTVAGSLTPNPDSSNELKVIINDPTYTSGKATISLSIGADPTKAIVTKTKIATLQLKATNTVAPVSPNVTFDPAPNTQILSVGNSDQTNENVLMSSTVPATVTVTDAVVIPTSTPSPVPTIPVSTVAPAPTGTPPACVSMSVDRATTGTAPYSLTFTVAGNDNGTINKASFTFGDGSIQDITTGGGIGTNTVNTQISHTYSNSGIYTAYATLTDNNNNLSAQQANCTQTITVNSGSVVSVPTVTAIPTQIIVRPTQVILPPTGPGDNILNIGVIGAMFTIIGGALVILL